MVASATSMSSSNGIGEAPPLPTAITNAAAQAFCP
jgi:hypothetical protein